MTPNGIGTGPLGWELEEPTVSYDMAGSTTHLALHGTMESPACSAVSSLEAPHLIRSQIGDKEFFACGVHCVEYGLVGV